MILESPAPNIIETRNLTARYGKRTILDNLSVGIPKGLITVILGGSGSGKTTLLRHLVGLNKPTGGKVIIMGQSLWDLSRSEDLKVRRKMGVLFQGGALFNSMTVAENVGLALREHTKLDDKVINIVTNMKLEQVGLAGFGDLMPEQLSGGMKKRAGLARALAMDPEILFVDEPSAGLDPITAAGLDELLINLKETFNMTIVVVTHELPSLFLIADWVYMIDRGKILFSGPLEELKKTDDQKVRQFLDRRPDRTEYDPEEHLRSLTAGV